MLNIKEMVKITNNIKFYRDKKGLTQKELAKKSNISERQLIRIEKGEQDPNISTVHRLARTLKITVEDLFPLPSEETSLLQNTQENSITES